MKVYILILSAVLFLLQACVSEPVIHKKSSENTIRKTEENEQDNKPESEKKLQSEFKKSAQDNKPETEITGKTNIKKSSVGPAKTVKIKIPSKPPELTPELERMREEALNQKNVPE